MGERVVVGRATPVESIDDPEIGGGGGGGAGAGTSSTEPLNYGRGDRAGDAWRWSRSWGAALLESARRLSGLFIVTLGGWQRVAFAFGLGCLLGGIGDCLVGFPRGSSDGPFWMFVGGVLIGLTVRVPLNKASS
jgi:hypothetical protein